MTSIPPLQKYFPYEKKKVADEMVERIREEFKLMLEELDWMDPQVG
jgi:predicted metalloendopeptidase